MNTQTKNKYGILAIVALSMLVGLVGGNALKMETANAQTNTGTATNTQTIQTAQNPPKNFDPAKGGHVGSNGKAEELLTGDTAKKVTDAALKAVPGGKIQRVETEVDGNGVYEAHMTKSDGSFVTVYLDSSFKVTSTVDGFGKGR